MTLLTDGGPENRGNVSRYLSENTQINQVIAQRDIIQSNSMVEAVNKHIKYCYLFKKNLKDLNEVLNYLPGSILDYNDKPHGKLYGLTPNEVLDGAMPKKDGFRYEIKAARENRTRQNQMVVCCQDSG